MALLDDQPIIPLLTNLTKRTKTHDLDGGWNALFTSIAKGSSGLTVADFLTLGAYTAYDFPSDTSTLTLANGTRLRFQNVAIPNFDFRGVRTGEALHQAVELNIATVKDMLVERSVPPLRASTRTTEHAHPPQTKRQTLQNPYQSCRVSHSTNPRPRGYPTPAAEHVDHHAGLFLPPSLPGVAVLQVASFSSLYAAISRDGDCQAADVTEFHRFLLAAMEKIDTLAKQNGTVRLVLDLQSNPGGFEATAGDIIAQLFPGTTKDVGTSAPKVRGYTWRARAHEAMDWVGSRVFSPSGESGPAIFAALHPVPSSQNENLSTFPSWSAFYGPESSPASAKGRHTHASFRNVNRDRLGIRMGGTYFTSATTPFTNPSKQIVVVTDGDCHSSCALLANWLVALGARSVALGGRPVSTATDAAPGKMELVGGTKGCTPLSSTSLSTQAMRALQAAPASAARNATLLALLPATTAPPIALAGFTVNTADVMSGGYGDGVTGGAVGDVPVQFVSKKADCRLWYDVEMVTDIEAVWRKVVEAVWGGGEKCVGGGGAVSKWLKLMRRLRLRRPGGVLLRSVMLGLCRGRRFGAAVTCWVVQGCCQRTRLLGV